MLKKSASHSLVMRRLVSALFLALVLFALVELVPVAQKKAHAASTYCQQHNQLSYQGMALRGGEWDDDHVYPLLYQVDLWPCLSVDQLPNGNVNVGFGDAVSFRNTIGYSYDLGFAFEEGKHCTLHTSLRDSSGNIVTDTDGTYQDLQQDCSKEYNNRQIGAYYSFDTVQVRPGQYWVCSYIQIDAYPNGNKVSTRTDDQGTVLVGV